jgi:hypothetical protein
VEVVVQGVDDVPRVQGTFAVGQGLAGLSAAVAQHGDEGERRVFALQQLAVLLRAAAQSSEAMVARMSA